MLDKTKKFSQCTVFGKFIYVLVFIIMFTLPSTAYGWGDSWPELAIDNPETASFDSGGIICVNAKTGQTLFGENEHKKYYPASTTKLLTALVAADNIDDFSQVTTVSDNAVNGIDPESSHIALRVGEKLSLEDLMYGLLLASGNDCAVAIAEDVAGSEEEFAELMNEKAEEIGCTESHFVNSNGLYDDDHYTTPSDLAKIIIAFSKNEQLVKYSSTLDYVIKKTNKSDERRHLWNNNRCVANKSHYYEPVVFGKSGYVTKSRFNLATYAEKDDMELAAVCMRSSSAGNICKDTISILQYYFDNCHEIPAKDLIPDDYELDIPGAGDAAVTVSKSSTLIVPKEISANEITYEEKAYENLDFPINPGTTVGQLTAVADGEEVGSIPLVTVDEVDSTFHNILKAAAVAAVFLIAFLIARAVRNRKKRNRTRRNRRAR